MQVSCRWMKIITLNNERYLCSNVSDAPRSAGSCIDAHGVHTCPLVTELRSGNATEFLSKCLTPALRKIIICPHCKTGQRAGLCISGIYNVHNSCNGIGFMLFPSCLLQKVVSFCTSFHLCSWEKRKAACFLANYILCFTQGLLVGAFRATLWLLLLHGHFSPPDLCLPWNAATG